MSENKKICLDSKWYGSLFNNLKVSKREDKPIYDFDIGDERAVIKESDALKLAYFLLNMNKDEIQQNIDFLKTKVSELEDEIKKVAKEVGRTWLVEPNLNDLKINKM